MHLPTAYDRLCIFDNPREFLAEDEQIFMPNGVIQMFWWRFVCTYLLPLFT